MRIFTAAMALSLISTAAMAGPFDGTWDFKEFCSNRSNDTRMTIAGDQVEFYESDCKMLNPTPLRDMGLAVLYDLQCNGEGEVYSGGRILYSITATGQLLSYSRGGYVSLRDRC